MSSEAGGVGPGIRRWVLTAGLCLCAATGSAGERTTVVGAARIDVTPRFPTILTGYGSRVGEHERVEQRLYARAIALGDRDTVVSVAVDNCGVPASVVRWVAQEVAQRHALPPERLVIAATHTHNAPSLTGYAPVIWAERATAEQLDRAARYTSELADALVEVVGLALESRRPASLAWGQGRVAFGGNRRVLVDGRWAGFGLQADGPVDHSLPVLIARDERGAPIALWLSYACHCTTLGAGNVVSGDWAGYAAEFLERDHPGCVALVTIGCGADVGPQPSGSVADARAHAEEIRVEVGRVIEGQATPIVDAPVVRHAQVQLPFAPIPDESHWRREAEGDGFAAVYARRQLARLERDGSLPQSLSYDVTTWSFGDALYLVFLPGEVAVDYAVRLKSELDWRRLWIQAWSNDVPCYIPSQRLLEEGGYETDFSMIYYDQPARFAPGVESTIVEAVKRQLGSKALAGADTPPPDFFAYRIPPHLLRRRWAHALREGDAAATEVALRQFEEAMGTVVAGFARLRDSAHGTSSWYDYSGGLRQRPLLRQTEMGAELSWETAPLRPEGTRSAVLFAGGIGWSSEPATEGFELAVDGLDAMVQFDITLHPSSWVSEDGRIRLDYLPTWRSTEDSAGFFLLSFTQQGIQLREAVTLRVRSRGAQSQRWFAVDPDPQAVDAAREVLAVAREVLR
jgi:neutral ceramidase